MHSLNILLFILHITSLVIQKRQRNNRKKTSQSYTALLALLMTNIFSLNVESVLLGNCSVLMKETY